MADFIDKIKVSVGGKDVGSKISKAMKKGTASVRSIVEDVKAVWIKDEASPIDIDIDNDGFDIDLGAPSQNSSNSAPVKGDSSTFTPLVKGERATGRWRGDSSLAVEPSCDEGERAPHEEAPKKPSYSEIASNASAIKEAIDAKMSDIARSTRELKDNIVGASARYEELTNELKEVAKVTEESQEQLEAVSGYVAGVKQIVDEIHSTTNSINKLYDSVFELKTANIELKSKLAGLTKLIKILGITAAALSAIAVILGITDILIFI